MTLEICFLKHYKAFAMLTTYEITPRYKGNLLVLSSVKQHEALYDLNRISDQQAKAAYMAIDASIFMLIPRHRAFEIPNEHLRYLARQLLGKPQRAYMRRYCSNVSQTGNICYTPLDMYDIHVSICRTSATRHIKHAELQEWFTDPPHHEWQREDVQISV